MPAVLVHGVPETDAIWGPLIDRLECDDVICLSPPGFGAPVPDGFDPVRTSYVDWLADSLEAIDGPIDLVGHDWGGGHVGGLVATRPELVRSWVVDVAGILHPDYEWHDMAQLWRTPDVGEETIAGMMSPSTDDKAVMFESVLGMPGDVATQVAAANDETMGRCILSLYRSAGPEDLASVWDGLPGAASRPGMVILATADHYIGPVERSVAVAERAGARTVTFEGLGHWWMLEDPDQGAAALSSFWADVAS